VSNLKKGNKVKDIVKNLIHWLRIIYSI
jgi:hypothetical protein